MWRYFLMEGYCLYDFDSKCGYGEDDMKNKDKEATPLSTCIGHIKNTCFGYKDDGGNDGVKCYYAGSCMADRDDYIAAYIGIDVYHALGTWGYYIWYWGKVGCRYMYKYIKEAVKKIWQKIKK